MGFRETESLMTFTQDLGHPQKGKWLKFLPHHKQATWGNLSLEGRFTPFSPFLR